MWGVDWVLRHLKKKEKKDIISFKRKGGKLLDADNIYESGLSEEFNTAVIHQILDVPSEDKRIHEEDNRAYQRKKKRDSESDSR